jgi:hypothetical protein
MSDAEKQARMRRLAARLDSGDAFSERYAAAAKAPDADALDGRPRRPTHCSECGSRDITPELICTGCGWWRDDLEDDATLTEDLPPRGWEVWSGTAWEYELPFTHSHPPPIEP